MQRQAVKKGIALKKNNSTKNPEKYELLKKFFALALLPVDQIEKIFNVIKAEIPAIHQAQFSKFLEYFEKTWIKGYKPKTISVFNTSNRTNNAIESYHRKLNKNLPANLNTSSFLSK